MDIIPYPDAVGNPYSKFPVFAFLQYFIHVYSRLLLTFMPVCGIIQAQTGNSTVCMNDFDALHDLMQGQAYGVLSLTVPTLALPSAYPVVGIITHVSGEE